MTDFSSFQHETKHYLTQSKDFFNLGKFYSATFTVCQEVLLCDYFSSSAHPLEFLLHFYNRNLQMLGIIYSFKNEGFIHTDITQRDAFTC